ncbi:MAG: MmgE/PrpD family protein [Actinomycetota bacterium]|nr:MmgE/PrpD family protein [Actinomycetota bacterium]
MNRNLTRQLAEFAAESSWEGLPRSAQEAARRLVMDAVGCALLGQRVNDAVGFDETVRRVAGGGTTTVIGGEPASPAGACLLNGYLVTAATICDVHLETQCHVCPEVLPPAFAIAEARHSSGAELLGAIAAGLELTVRVGQGLLPPIMRQRGWHAPGLIGPLGGAVAGARLLGLDAAGHVAALGIAGSQAAGTFAQWGSLTVKFHQARGALSALLAAELAADGFTTAGDVLTSGDGGLFTTYSNGGDPAIATEGLGSRYELEQISMRPWPVAAYLQCLAMALDELLSTATSDTAPSSVHVDLSEKSYGLHGEMEGTSSFSARLSARYVTAVALTDRKLWFDQFSDERVRDLEVTELARRVTVSADRHLDGGGARVTVEWPDGSRVTREATEARGEPTLPLGEEELKAKFVRCGEGRASAHELARIADRLWRLEDERDAGDVIKELQRLMSPREMAND